MLPRHLPPEITMNARIKNRPLPESTAPSGAIESPMHALLTAMQAVPRGDFSVRVSGAWAGLEGKLANSFNDAVEASQRTARELERIGHGVGKQGKTRQRISLAGRGGAWEGMER